MPAGLEVYNDSGLYQIDGTKPNPAFQMKGSASGSVTFNSPSYPLVFIRPSLAYKTSLRYNGGSSYTFFCPNYFEYWIFANETNPNSTNFGLQIFNEASQLVYTSNTKPLKIDRVVTYGRPNISSFPPQYGYLGYNQLRGGIGRNGVADLTNLLPGYNYAFGLSITGARSGFDSNSGGGPGIGTSIMIFEAFQLSGTGFKIVEYVDTTGVQALGQVGPDYWIGAPGTVVVADISGY